MYAAAMEFRNELDTYKENWGYGHYHLWKNNCDQFAQRVLESPYNTYDSAGNRVGRKLNFSWTEYSGDLEATMPNNIYEKEVNKIKIGEHDYYYGKISHLRRAYGVSAMPTGNHASNIGSECEEND